MSDIEIQVHAADSANVFRFCLHKPQILNINVQIIEPGVKMQPQIATSPLWDALCRCVLGYPLPQLEGSPSSDDRKYAFAIVRAQILEQFPFANKDNFYLIEDMAAWLNLNRIKHKLYFPYLTLYDRNDAAHFKVCFT